MQFKAGLGEPVNFTVVLLYPEHLTNDFGEATYTAHVEARSPREARTLARLEAMQANEDCDDGEDFGCVAVFRGWLTNEAPAQPELSENADG